MAAQTGLQIFTSFLLVSIFYAVAVTLIVPILPDVQGYQLVVGTNSNGVISITNLAASMQQGVTNQTNIPLLDFGALIFYSSNIIINLMLNFFTAIPQMITILFTAFFMMFPIAPGLATNFKIFFQAIVTIIYIIAILTFIMGTRTGRPVA